MRSSFLRLPLNLLLLIMALPFPSSASNELTKSSSCSADQDTIEINIIFDSYVMETKWSLVEGLSGTFASGGPYSSDQSSVDTFACISKNSSCVVFTIFDTSGDGLCCDYGNGSYQISVNGAVLKLGGNFTYTETTIIGSSAACISEVTSSPTSSPSMNQSLWTDNTPSPTSSSTMKPRNQFINRSDLYEAVSLWINDGNYGEVVYGHISTWDVSEITDMSYLFAGRFNFNDDISAWITSKVTTMYAMFGMLGGARFTDASTVFDDSLSDWNTSKVGTAFNRDLSAWDTSKVTSMAYMFYNAKAFNQTLCWNVSTVSHTDQMFDGSNGRLGTCSRITLDYAVDLWIMENDRARYLYGNVSTWDVSKITDMSSLFQQRYTFNDDISTWSTSKVTNMASMFKSASSFNQSLNRWDTALVQDMSFMFSAARSFNHPLNAWSTSNVTNMSWMFSLARTFDQTFDSWNTSGVDDMSGMFFGASKFNCALESWVVSKVTDMNHMFASAETFNQALQAWNVSSVLNMNKMFYLSSSFNQDLSSWNIDLVTNMDHMFMNASNFRQILCWNHNVVSAKHARRENETVLGESGVWYWGDEYDDLYNSLQTVIPSNNIFYGTNGSFASQIDDNVTKCYSKPPNETGPPIVTPAIVIGIVVTSGVVVAGTAIAVSALSVTAAVTSTAVVSTTVSSVTTVTAASSTGTASLGSAAMSAKQYILLPTTTFSSDVLNVPRAPRGWKGKVPWPFYVQILLSIYYALFFAVEVTREYVYFYRLPTSTSNNDTITSILAQVDRNRTSFVCQNFTYYRAGSGPLGSKLPNVFDNDGLSYLFRPVTDDGKIYASIFAMIGWWILFNLSIIVMIFWNLYEGFYDKLNYLWLVSFHPETLKPLKLSAIYSLVNISEGFASMAIFSSHCDGTSITLFGPNLPGTLSISNRSQKLRVIFCFAAYVLTLLLLLVEIMTRKTPNKYKTLKRCIVGTAITLVGLRFFELKGLSNFQVNFRVTFAISIISLLDFIISFTVDLLIKLWTHYPATFYRWVCCGREYREKIDDMHPEALISTNLCQDCADQQEPANITNEEGGTSTSTCDVKPHGFISTNAYCDAADKHEPMNCTDEEEGAIYSIYHAKPEVLNLDNVYQISGVEHNPVNTTEVEAALATDEEGCTTNSTYHDVKPDLLNSENASLDLFDEKQPVNSADDEEDVVASLDTETIINCKNVIKQSEEHIGDCCLVDVDHHIINTA